MAIHTIYMFHPILLRDQFQYCGLHISVDGTEGAKAFVETDMDLDELEEESENNAVDKATST